MNPLWGFASLHIQTFDLILYSYILNRFILFCISTYSIVLCCSVFLHIQSFYVLYFDILIYVVLYVNIFNYVAFISTYSIVLFCSISTYSILLCCSIFLHNQQFYVVLYLFVLNCFMLLCISTYCSVFLHLKLFDLVLYFMSSIEVLKIKYI